MPAGDVTQLLQAVNTGRPEAYEELLRALYDELRRMAGFMMWNERAGHTLQPTALVHEAYLRLVDADPRWESRSHFYGAAARAMRRILVEHARRKSAGKRGGDARRVTFADLAVQVESPQLDVLALDEALNELAKIEPRLVKAVELRYFTGCSLEETAQLLGLSTATLKRDWSYARAWLHDYLNR